MGFPQPKRGALAIGKLADLAMWNRNQLGVPRDEIGQLHSPLTLAGGRVGYADAAFRKFE